MLGLLGWRDVHNALHGGVDLGEWFGHVGWYGLLVKQMRSKIKCWTNPYKSYKVSNGP